MNAPTSTVSRPSKKSPRLKPGTYRKLNAVSQARLIKLLLNGESTPTELAEESGLNVLTVRSYCRELYKAKAAYVAAWEKDSQGREVIPVYKLGYGRDAKRTVKTRTEVQRDYRKRVHLRDLIARLANPITREEALNVL